MSSERRFQALSFFFLLSSLLDQLRPPPVPFCSLVAREEEGKGGREEGADVKRTAAAAAATDALITEQLAATHATDSQSRLRFLARPRRSPREAPPGIWRPSAGFSGRTPNKAISRVSWARDRGRPRGLPSPLRPRPRVCPRERIMTALPPLAAASDRENKGGFLERRRSVTGDTSAAGTAEGPGGGARAMGCTCSRLYGTRRDRGREREERGRGKETIALFASKLLHSL